MEFLTKELIYQKSPQEITSLLYEAAIDDLSNAIHDIYNKQFIDANIKLKNVNDILHRFGVGLNYEAGIIADQLDALYNYMAERVIEGNLKKDPVILKEVLEILNRIADAWNASLKEKPNVKADYKRQKANAYEKQVLVYERDTNTVEEGK
ncbi:flagellar export chaperone FliS [Falsibacillus albus]|uniref:Flagellar export chaperone FliS n=1 Tax=Falsibacillus albus TaxID=2478915 RepID=A0A3L7K168_9BACI|nr:flagellar export chaperone FliS [Falsibacillus albus]RLQ96796.1 flagellar export chaperone FliS [Falsibacillus albus]